MIINMKNIYIYFAFTFFLITAFAFAQPANMKTNGAGMRNITGRMYGKIVDGNSGKSIHDASVQIWQDKFDSSTNKIKAKLIAGQLTESNGDFSLEGIPLIGLLKLKITALGFLDFEKNISFDIKPGKGKGMENMLNLTDKDLGNIKILPNINELAGVVIKADEPSVKMSIDKKVYNMDKNLNATGGNAQDALKNIPSVNVDIDGNVTMRNASPQIFVDGRPTTLTLDQIPADNIQSIEIITNPSVKYDASGGMAGIINIVLKKNKRMGYNGNARFGIDKRTRINAGIDLNVREKKINFFLASSMNQRKSIAEGWSDRINYLPNDSTRTKQLTYGVQKMLMATNRVGFDYFIDNRNTITVSANYTQGNHNPFDSLRITYADYPTDFINSYANRSTASFRNFKNLGNSILYKHLFPKAGQELTADLNGNFIRAIGGADAITHYTNDTGWVYQNDSRQNSAYKGGSSFYTAQVDYTNPLTDHSKLDIGVRSAYRIFTSTNTNTLYNSVDPTKISIAQKNSYQYNDLVNAAYVNYSNQKKKWGYQAGLRIESSNYNGKLTDTIQKISIPYPISLFPSFAASYKIRESQDLNLNLSRRINRPGFFQLMPYLDFSDSLNLSRGNPNLRPEFTYSSEISYLYAYKNNQSFMANIYAKLSTGLITKYILQEFNNDLNKNIIVTSYENALRSSAYGLEVVAKNTIKKWFDVTSNINIYQSQIVTQTLNNKQFSWFAKVNANFKIYKTWNLQISGDYFSRMAFQQGSDGGGGRMMGGGGGTQNSAQGYTLPNYSADAAIKKEFLKSKALAVTLNFTDIFHTKRMYSISNSQYFHLESFKQRDWQFFRLNISYKFGKFDTSLFKRKNNRNTNDGEGMM